MRVAATTTIAGTVTDSATGLPIVGAEVGILDPDINYITSTDGSGRYVLSGGVDHSHADPVRVALPTGPHTVMVSKDGYK